MFELILFICDLFTEDTVDESVYWFLCLLALYSYCKTSRSIFESACECTCAVMHSVDKPLWVVRTQCICWGKGDRSHTHTHIQHIHVVTQAWIHTHTLPEPRGIKGSNLLKKKNPIRAGVYYHPSGKAVKKREYVGGWWWEGCRLLWGCKSNATC